MATSPPPTPSGDSKSKSLSPRRTTLEGLPTPPPSPSAPPPPTTSSLPSSPRESDTQSTSQSLQFSASLRSRFRGKSHPPHRTTQQRINEINNRTKSKSNPDRKNASSMLSPPRRKSGRKRKTRVAFEQKDQGVTFDSFVKAFDESKVQVGVFAVVGIDHGSGGQKVRRIKRYVQVNWVGRRARFTLKAQALPLKLAVSARLGGVRVEIDCSNTRELTPKALAKSLLMAAGSHPPECFQLGDCAIPTTSIEIGLPSFLIEHSTFSQWRLKRWKTSLTKVSSHLKFSKPIRRRAFSVDVDSPRMKTSQSDDDIPFRLSMPERSLTDNQGARSSLLGGDNSDPESARKHHAKEGSVRWRIARLERASSDSLNQSQRRRLDSKVARLGSVFLVRHGERLDHINPGWRINAVNPFDSPLSDNGLQQAKETGIRLRTERIHEILASPFLRTIQTAVEIAKQVGAQVCIERGIAEHVDPDVLSRWKERNRGVLKRTNVDEFKVTTMTLEQACAHFPGYIDRSYRTLEDTTYPETEEQLFERTNSIVQKVTKKAREKKRNICIVSHQDPCEYMAHEIDGQRAQDKFVSYCCITKAILKGKRHRLVMQHDDAHLSSPEIPRD